MKRNSLYFQNLSGFYKYILNISQIRQFDHIFIPLLFHWNAGLYKRQLLQKGFISNYYMG
jgi:hypothetical protein